MLKVSASGYRQYRARQTGGTGPLQPGRRHVKAIFNEMKGAYGQPRTWRELSARGIQTGKGTFINFRTDKALSIRRQCALLSLARSGVYRPPSPVSLGWQARDRAACDR